MLPKRNNSQILTLIASLTCFAKHSKVMAGNCSMLWNELSTPFRKRERKLVLSTWFGHDWNMEYWIENFFVSLWIVLILMYCGRLRTVFFFNNRILYLNTIRLYIFTQQSFPLSEQILYELKMVKIHAVPFGFLFW